MDFVHSIIDNNGFPAFTAFLLGLVVALHPCHLAANVAAMGYMARDAHDRRRVLANGLAYVLGRALAYSLLGVVLVEVFAGTDGLGVAGRWLGEWGEKALAPVLVAMGLYFAVSGFVRKRGHCHGVPSRAGKSRGAWGSLLLGVLLALSFCPESAVVYFGMLLPLSLRSPGGFLLPLVFSVATSLPALFLAWAVACGMGGVSAASVKMLAARRLVNVVVGVMFMVAGVFCMAF